MEELELNVEMEEVKEQVVEGITEVDPAATTKGINNQTARAAAQILVDKNVGFIVPTAHQRNVLLVAFAKTGAVIYGRAFDLVKAPSTVNLDDEKSVTEHLNQITIFELKSTKRKLDKNFRSYFFSMSTAELLVAQSLGKRFKFVFVNVQTKEHRELTLLEIYQNARGIYPSWSIRF